MVKLTKTEIKFKEVFAAYKKAERYHIELATTIHPYGRGFGKTGMIHNRYMQSLTDMLDLEKEIDKLKARIDKIYAKRELRKNQIEAKPLQEWLGA